MTKQVKICCNGETKRLKISGDYAELIERTKASFGFQSEQDGEIKFYYIDDANDVISITSQSDLTEALNIDDLGSLRLTVARDMQQALEILRNSIMINKSLAGSVRDSQAYLNQSRSSRIRAFSDFDLASQAESNQMGSPFEKQQPVPPINLQPVLGQRDAKAWLEPEDNYSAAGSSVRRNPELFQGGVALVGMANESD